MFSLLNGVIIIPCKDPLQSNELLSPVHWAMHSKWRNLSFWNLTNGKERNTSKSTTKPSLILLYNRN